MVVEIAGATAVFCNEYVNTAITNPIIKVIINVLISKPTSQCIYRKVVLDVFGNYFMAVINDLENCQNMHSTTGRRLHYWMNGALIFATTKPSMSVYRFLDALANSNCNAAQN